MASRMKFSVLGSVVSGLFLSLSAQAGVGPTIDPVYGADDRLDLYDVTDPLALRLADSTVALVNTKKLVLDSSGLFFETRGASLRDRQNLCSTERFVDQLTLAFCSGALVGPDLVLTAGHCVEKQLDCDNMKVAFGFGLREKDAKTTRLPVDEVYQCAKIVGRTPQLGGADFAVVQLDRPVVGHDPLEIERSTRLEVGTPLVVIGHPSGIPAKVSGNAKVRENSDLLRFKANLDTYHGNSGSAVFNARTGLIEGILVSGETDYAFDSIHQCNRDKQCTDEGCRGEMSTRISFAAPFIPEL
jgi:S1-C subfamily serine protease